MNTSISIALATYNGAAHLEEQLQSFINQTILPDELVVSDDSSIDESCQIIEAFAHGAPFPVLLIRNNENVGHIANFNIALSSCSGDIVFLSDQDDVWLPQKIERVLSGFKERPDTQLVIHDLEYCKEDLTPIGQTKMERMKGTLDIEKDYVTGMATAIRGDFLKLCLPVPEKQGISHDGWLHTCALALGKKVTISDALALYRRHSNCATASSILNVDYVTSNTHFKSKSKIHWMEKPKFFLETESALACWLVELGETLVQTGYLSLASLNELVNQEQIRVCSFSERERILALPRVFRIRPVARMYWKGGYRYFNGIKSAAKDLLLK